MLVEVSQAVGLVALRSDMHHVDPHFILGFDVGPVLHQQLYHLDVPVEARIMQGIEPLISLGGCVDPFGYLLLNLLMNLLLLGFGYLFVLIDSSQLHY